MKDRLSHPLTFKPTTIENFIFENDFLSVNLENGGGAKTKPTDSLGLGTYKYIACMMRLCTVLTGFGS